MTPVNSPSPAPTSQRIVRCPTCKGDSIYAPENAFRPFCSERCKNVDLGAWAAEDYRVSASPPPFGEGTDAPEDLR